jgi:hypothetical protein
MGCALASNTLPINPSPTFIVKELPNEYTIQPSFKPTILSNGRSSALPSLIPITSALITFPSIFSIPNNSPTVASIPIHSITVPTID